MFDALPPRRGMLPFRDSLLMAAEKKPHLQPPALSWSSIPLELAGLVLSLLPAHADRARFAAVCPQWRAAARQQQRLHPPLPLIALPDGTFYSLPYPTPFRFPGCGFAGYQSACGSWLVFPRDDGCFLVDPFSRETVTLPPLSSVRLRPPNAVAKWSYEHGTKLADPYLTWMHIKDSDELHISKLVLCSTNLVVALVGIGYTSQILMCQPGALSWSVRAYDRCKGFEDMSFYQGKLYALTKEENLLVVNISEDHSTGDPQVSRIGQVIKGDPWYSIAFTNNAMLCKKLYLVESCGAMLMVRRTIFCRVPHDGGAVAGPSAFEVFKADFEHSGWVKVSTVGADQVLFLGRRCSRSLPFSRYGVPGDHILFLDDDEENRTEYGYAEENTSYGTYAMGSGRYRSVHPDISWKRGDEMRLAAWLFPHD
ncbi:F-box protein At2g26160-like isoform X1 [Triticum urartu]|uniref:F-box protein At2g26160-like isoform X1 n=2 Tax=Triticum dicoccoides TaxID=85692 RepID=UPI0018902946|nr:F-box protein At2g26160-like isoform X1 [Triticum dicoccoides]XP_048549470.1 F-box protein At2g26160-like isoform X1 [Triticum urartu]